MDSQWDIVYTGTFLHGCGRGRSNRCCGGDRGARQIIQFLQFHGRLRKWWQTTKILQYFCQTHANVLFRGNWYFSDVCLICVALQIITFPEIHLWCYLFPTSWQTALWGIDQVHILPKDITGTSEAQTNDHHIMSSMRYPLGNTFFFFLYFHIKPGTPLLICRSWCRETIDTCPFRYISRLYPLLILSLYW